MQLSNIIAAAFRFRILAASITAPRIPNGHIRPPGPACITALKFGESGPKAADKIARVVLYQPCRASASGWGFDEIARLRSFCSCREAIRGNWVHRWTSWTRIVQPSKNPLAGHRPIIAAKSYHHERGYFHACTANQSFPAEWQIAFHIWLAACLSDSLI